MWRGVKRARVGLGFSSQLWLSCNIFSSFVLILFVGGLLILRSSVANHTHTFSRIEVKVEGVKVFTRVSDHRGRSFEWTSTPAEDDGAEDIQAKVHLGNTQRAPGDSMRDSRHNRPAVSANYGVWLSFPRDTREWF